MKKINWYELTKKFNNVDYKLGSLNIEDGLDCATAMFRFLEGMGYDISKWNNDDWYFEFDNKKINRNNYSTELKPEQHTQALYTIINKDFIKTDKLEKGCVCITNLVNNYCICIYLGFNNFLIVTKENGLRIIKLPKKNIKEIYKYG